MSEKIADPIERAGLSPPPSMPRSTSIPTAYIPPVNVAIAAIEKRWLIDASSTTTSMIPNTSSAAMTDPSSPNPLRSQPFAPTPDRVEVVDAEDQRAADDATQHLTGPVADSVTRGDLTDQHQRQREHRVGDRADHADRRSPSPRRTTPRRRGP